MAKKNALNFFEVFASLHNEQTKEGMGPEICEC